MVAAGTLILFGCAGGDTEKSGPSVTTATPVAPNRFSPEALTRSRKRIDSLEARVREAVASPTKAPDVSLTMYMIQAYQYFAADFPDDPRAAESLDRAGQLYGGVLGDHRKAVEYYEKAYEKYPKYKNRPQLLVQEGVAAEAAGDTASAAIAYQRLLGEYPQHPLAAQGRGLLKLMRMSEGQKRKTFGGK